MDIKKSTKIALAMQNKKRSELADYLGVRRTYMSTVLSGRVGVSTERLQKIADFFGMKVSEFIALGE